MDIMFVDMIELKFPKKNEKESEIVLPVTQQYLKLAKDVNVAPQMLPNLAFAFLDVCRQDPELVGIMKKIITSMQKPIPQEIVPKS